MIRKLMGLLMFFLLSSSLCLGQQLPTKQQQYDFLRWCLKDNPTKKQFTLLDTLENFENGTFAFEDINRLAGKDFSLNKADTMFLLAQVKANRSEKVLDLSLFKTHQKKISKGSSIPTAQFSLPIFSKDGTIAFIKWTLNCSAPGFICRYAGINAYKKIKGKWHSSNSILRGLLT